MQTVSDLQDAVQRELSWRKVEISAIRSEANQAISAPHSSRGGQVLLCAHWEGFLKSSVRLYFQHIFLQGYPLAVLKPEFIAVAIYQYVMKAAESKYPGSEDHHLRLAKHLGQAWDREGATSTWNIDKEGNPSSEVVERVLVSAGIDPKLGFDSATWTTMRAFINEQLVKERNEVAHGENRPVRHEELGNRADRLLILLERLAEQLINAAQDQKYLANTVHLT